MADNTPERPTRYTITEKFNADQTVATWTARVGRTVAVKIEALRERGMWDTDLLRSALAEHAGVAVEDVRPVRARGEISVAPRVWEVHRPEVDTLPVAEEHETAPAEDVTTLYAPGELVRVTPQHYDTHAKVYVPQPEFIGTVIGYTRNGAYKVREPQHGTACDYDAARELRPLVEDVEHRMYVGILRDDVKDMGTVQAANVRAAIKNGWEESGHRAEHLDDGTIKVGYSFFVPQRPGAIEPRPAAEVLAADPIPAGTSVLEGMPEGKVTSANIDGMYVVQKRHGDHWSLPNHDDPRVISRESVITGLSYVRQRGGKVGQDANGTIYASNGRQAERYIPAALFSDLVEGHCPGCKTLDASNGDGPCTGGRSVLKEAEEAPDLDEMGTDDLLTVLREEAPSLPAGSRFAEAWRLMDEILTNGGIECLPAPWDGYADNRAPQAVEEARFRPVENIRPGWWLKRADGSWKCVSKVNERNGPHCVVRVDFADGSTDDLPVNTEALSLTGERAQG